MVGVVLDRSSLVRTTLRRSVVGDRARSVTKVDGDVGDLSDLTVGILYHRHDVATDDSFTLLSRSVTASLLA
jgi:hypothetical protein